MPYLHWPLRLAYFRRRCGQEHRHRALEPNKIASTSFGLSSSAASQNHATAFSVFQQARVPVAVLGLHRRAYLRAAPNPSPKLTRYGKRCKPGPRHLVHHREPGLQRPPPRAA